MTKFIGWLLFAAGIVMLIYGGKEHGRAYFIIFLGMILVGLVLAMGLEKVLDGVVKIIEWIIEKMPF